eukprot:11699157-Alexandrium_andersonii.AAC.1
MHLVLSISLSVSATAARSSAKRARVADCVSATIRLAGARTMESIPSMARGSPCGAEPGDETGQG